MSGHLLFAPQWLGLSGLWLIDAKGRRTPVDAEEIGLSDDLADRLESWMDAFDAIFDEDDEAASAFSSAAEQAEWLGEGAALLQAITTELGKGWRIDADLTGWMGKART